MKKIWWVFLIFVSMAAGCNMPTTQTGKYHIDKIQAAGASTVFMVLDPEEGHIWTWGKAALDKKGVYSYLVYEGKIRPGKEPGETVFTFTNVDKQD